MHECRTEMRFLVASSRCSQMLCGDVHAVLLMYSGVSAASAPDALGEAFLVMDVADALLQRMQQQRPQVPSLLQPAQQQMAETAAGAVDGTPGTETHPDGTAGRALSSSMQHCLTLCLKVQHLTLNPAYCKSSLEFASIEQNTHGSCLFDTYGLSSLHN